MSKCVRVVRFLSTLGLAAYFPFLGYVFLLSVLGGMSASATSGFAAGPTFFIVILPFFYFVYCLLSTRKRFKGPLLLVSGIIAHSLMLPVIVMTFHSAISAIIGLAFLAIIAAWFGMFFERRSN